MLDAKNRMSGKNKKLRIEVTAENANNKQHVIYSEEAILQIRKQQRERLSIHFHILSAHWRIRRPFCFSVQ